MPGLTTRADLIEAYRSEHGVYEINSQQRLGEGFIALRLDGRSFSSLTKSLEKPFDKDFHSSIEAVAEHLMREITDAVYCYCQSDELTLVMRKDADFASRRIEKLVSSAAALATLAFVESSPKTGGGTFDCRTLLCPGEEDVMAMLAERQQDSLKNAATALAYWRLRQQEGLSGRAAERRLRPLSMRGRIDLCSDLGSPFNDLAPEQRRGRACRVETFLKEGFNPLTEETVLAERRRIVWDRDLGDFRHLTISFERP